jgi:hypothetical protein
VYSCGKYDKEDKLYLVTSLIRLPVFERYVVLYGRILERHVF